MKSSLGILEVLAHLETLHFDFNDFLHSLEAEIYQNENVRAPETAKMANFELLYSPKLISRKI